MTSPKEKFIEDEGVEDFEIFDGDEEDFTELNVDDSTKTLKKVGFKNLKSGTSLLFSTLCSITEEQELILTIPVKAAAAMAATTLTGTLIGGVPGMAAGFLVGAYFTYRKSTDKMQNMNSLSGISTNKYTLRQFLNEMTTQQKKDLLRELFKCLKQSNVRLLVTEICRNDKIRGIALQILSEFLFKKMGVKLTKSKSPKKSEFKSEKES